MLADPPAKTAHGLIRTSDRYDIVGVIDGIHAGKNARDLVGSPGHIPVFPDVGAALEAGLQIDFAIIGVAPKGGKLPPEMRAILADCLEHNISLVSGLHEFLSEDPALIDIASRRAQTLTDIRKPPDRRELHFWTGKIREVTCPIVTVLGLETNLGKRTTAKMLKDTCIREGIRAQMVFTWQTGWLQDGSYGFVLDTTVNDFVSGELEYWLTRCWEETQPEVIFLEGQSGLRNPSGPCGSELLVSGNARYTVLVFSPKRRYYNGNPDWGILPSVEDEIALIGMYGSRVIGLVLNTQQCTAEEVRHFRSEYAARTGLPVLTPLETGVSDLIPVIRSLMTPAAPEPNRS